MSADEPISSFVVERDKLTRSDIWKILLYCASADNEGEKWEVEISDKYDWVSGSARGQDTGKFWEFLCENKLDKHIDIVRG